MLLFATILKLVAEIALFAFAGQALLFVLAGAGRDGNLFYRTLRTITSPFVRVARWITPRIVLDRHIPLATFMLALLMWLAATAWKISLCIEMGVNQCR